MKNFLGTYLFVFVFIAGISCGGGGGGNSDGSGNTDTTETKALKTAVTESEDAFLSGEPDKVLAVLSQESAAFYTDDIDSISSKMVSFGNDFKSRKLVYASDNYAEYEFSANDKTYTVTFSCQEDGTWKLTRF